MKVKNHISNMISVMGKLGRFAFLVPISITFLYWLSLIYRYPIFQQLPYWFWRFTNSNCPLSWLILPLILYHLITIYAIKKFPSRPIIVLVILILLGYFTQNVFGYMEGMGINGIRVRTVKTGHAEFAREASKLNSILDTTKNYKNLIETKEISKYPNSTKPPGQLLFYMITERFSIILTFWSNDSFTRLTTFISFMYPLITYLACAHKLIVISD